MRRTSHDGLTVMPGGREKTEDAYKKVGLSISGMASRLAGWQEPAFPSVRSSPRPDNMDRHYQTCRPSPARPAAEMKALDLAAQEMGRTTEYSASRRRGAKADGVG